MNILLVNADGPKSFGLQVLRNAIRQYWKEATVYVLSPGFGPSSSMGGSPYFRRELSLGDETVFTREDTNFYSCPSLTPVDAIDFAFLRHELFIPQRATWDLVLSGVAEGHVVGTDIFRSGTTGAALYASATYRVGSHAIAQHLGEHEGHGTPVPASCFSVSQKILPDYFQTSLAKPGECWVVNFPPEKPQGYQVVPPAHYSLRRQPPTELVPRARDEKSDVTLLAKGFITTSILSLRVHQPLRY